MCKKHTFPQQWMDLCNKVGKRKRHTIWKGRSKTDFIFRGHNNDKILRNLEKTF